MKTNTMNYLERAHNKRRYWQVSICCSVCLLFAVLLPSPARCDQGEPNFGVGFNLANYPECTADDYLRSLSDIYVLGGHSGFVWHWCDSFSLEDRIFDLTNIKTIGLKVFVQISVGLLGVPSPPEGYVKSFSDPETRAVYLDNVRSYAEARPDYINLATEANFMYEWNLYEWNNYKSLYKEAFDLIKEISPETKVGVSYHYGVFIWKRQFHLPYELGPHDYVAFTDYPAWLISEGFYSSIEDIPSDWYTIVRRAYPDTPIIFSEIGWSSEGGGSPEEQVRFIENIPRLMSGVRPEQITWLYLHDTSYFNPLWADLLSPRAKELLEELEVNLPLLFKQFNGMGLKKLDGTIKPAWHSVLNLHFSPSF